jgi:hypothetical protein
MTDFYTIGISEIEANKDNTNGLLNLLCFKYSEGAISNSITSTLRFVTNYGVIKLQIHNRKWPAPMYYAGYIYLDSRKSDKLLTHVEVSTIKKTIPSTGNNSEFYDISILNEINILEPFEGLLRKLTKKEDIVILNYPELQNSYVKPAKRSQSLCD